MQELEINPCTYIIVHPTPKFTYIYLHMNVHATYINEYI